MKPEIKDSLKHILLGVVISIPITIFLYNTIGVLLIKLIFDEQTMKSTEIYTPVYVALAFFYPLVCNFCYILHLTENSSIPQENVYHLRNDILRYFRTEGKLLLIVYGICAIIFEAAYIFSGDGLNIISAIFLFCFPLAYTIPLPVIRTIVAYAVTMVLISALFFFNRKINFHKWH
ncbi:MAG: hypothetical protein IKU40_12505 [Clostridia bacterium]|nr:hypothetical protein [Clostridia bacterium]